MRTQRLIKKIIPDCLIIRRLPESAGNSVLLTFDDGPSAIMTPQVLDLLDEYNVKAIFFVVGEKAEQHPEVLNEIFRRGHVIANHSYSHPEKPSNNPFAIYRDTKKCQLLIEQYNNQKNHYYRPPCGRLTLLSVIVLKLMGMKIVLWSNEDKDWECRTKDKAIKIAKNMADSLEKRDILLLHDENKYSIQILKELMELIVRKGFSFSDKL